MHDIEVYGVLSTYDLSTRDSHHRHLHYEAGSVTAFLSVRMG